MIDTSKLSDTELNRAMAWLFPESYKGLKWDCSISSYMGFIKIGGGAGLGVVDFLSNYDLTMPLAVRRGINIGYIHYLTVAKSGTLIESINENPLRAICEVLVQIAMNGK